MPDDNLSIEPRIARINNLWIAGLILTADGVVFLVQAFRKPLTPNY